MIWFTADTHFGHTSIISKCHRPFKSVEDMDEGIISRINLCVKPTDILYHLGDFAWTGTWRAYRDRIHCQTIHLIAGNHDSSRQLIKAKKEGLFESIERYQRIKADGLRVIACHYPIQIWEPGFVHLHGHTHGSLVPHIDGRKDVGADAQSYAPVSEGIIREMTKRPENDNRHSELTQSDS